MSDGVENTRVAREAGGSPRLRPTTLLGAAGLVLLCLVVYLPGVFSLPPIDRDEARFAQASRQMLESGDWVVPRVQDRPRLNKPPMIYWLQAGSAGVFTLGRPERDAIWMYRVPSLLAAVASVLFVWRLGGSMFDARTGRLAAALFAVCPIVAWEARQARADMVLVACTTLAMWALWEIYSGGGSARQGAPAPEAGRGRAWRWALVFWLAIAAGVLTKGPITPMVALLTVVILGAFTGRWAWVVSLHPWFGLPLAAAIVYPWVWAVAQRVGWSDYLETIRAETLGRSVSTREGHWGPPGYHTVLMPALFWPGSLLVGLAGGMAFRQAFEWRGAGRDRPVWSCFADAVRGRWLARPAAAPYLFCLAWVLPSWIVFEIVSTKLPHYTMPLYPALALLASRAVFAAEAGLLPGVRSRLSRLGILGWLLIGLAFAGAVCIPGAFLSRSAWGFAVIAACGALGFVFALRHLRIAAAALDQGRFLKAQLAGIAVATALGVVLPIALSGAFGLTRAAVREIEKIDPHGDRPLAAASFHEDSLVFLTRGRVERIDAPSAGGWLESNPRGVLIAPLGVASDIPRARVIASVKGLHYSRGKVELLSILERAP